VNIQLSPLIELQKLDLRIAEAKEERRRIPERLDMAEAPLRDAKRILSESSVAVEAYTKEKRSHEKDLEAHEDRIEKMKDRASQLKTNQEYQAHLFEIDLANKKKGEIEEKILLAMEKLDQLQRQVKEAQANAAEAERRFTEEKSKLDEQDRRLASELAELEGKQRELAAKVDKPLLDRYTKLKSARKDHALAAVKDGICRGCRLQLPPQLVAQVKRMTDLHTCPYCHRMLYWDGAPASETKKSEEPETSQSFELGESI
jgi:predicted  nucleic acid-binding Zn-ribbon protein